MRGLWWWWGCAAYGDGAAGGVVLLVPCCCVSSDVPLLVLMVCCWCAAGGAVSPVVPLHRWRWCSASRAAIPLLGVWHTFSSHTPAPLPPCPTCAGDAGGAALHPCRQAAAPGPPPLGPVPHQPAAQPLLPEGPQPAGQGVAALGECRGRAQQQAQLPLRSSLVQPKGAACRPVSGQAIRMGLLA